MSQPDTITAVGCTAEGVACTSRMFCCWGTGRSARCGTQDRLVPSFPDSHQICFHELLGV